MTERIPSIWVRDGQAWKLHDAIEMHLECLSCGHREPAKHSDEQCVKCGGLERTLTPIARRDVWVDDASVCPACADAGLGGL